MRECAEIVSIIVASINTARGKTRRKSPEDKNPQSARSSPAAAGNPQLSEGQA
jgi:hypothetical protein